MRKYFLFVIVFGLLGAMTFTSCKKESEATFPLVGTKWIGTDLFDLLTNRYANGELMHVLAITGEGVGTLKTIDAHTSGRASVVIKDEPITWTLIGNAFNVTTSAETFKGDLSYSNRNVNFMRKDSSYIGYDQINLTNSLSTKVFRGTFVKVGTTTPMDVVWIFLSGKGFKMMFPKNTYALYPLSKYELDNTGKLLVHYFGGTASSAVAIDYTNHGGNYTASNDSIVYRTTSVPTANVYNGSYNWRGVFRLKEVK
jgi:hypothetical protein